MFRNNEYGNHPDMPAGALRGVKVLDMSGLAGQYCGKMFADLGADVILIEPLRGSKVRSEGPFLDERVHPEYSLPFIYFNAGKRSVCIDLDHADGQEVFLDLVAKADVLIESEKPGVMASRALGYEELSKRKPDLIMTSITPFGQSGPYAQYECSDLVALAMGGFLSLGGYPDSQPIAAYGNQAYLAASQFAAVASMIALLSAADECRGTHIDVSIQECVVMAMENAIQFYDLEGTVRKRDAGVQRLAGMGVFKCVDGEVYLMAGGISSSRFWENTVNWLVESGIDAANVLRDSKWQNQDFLATVEAKATFAEIFGPFARSRTKDTLYHEGQSRRIPICPINTTKDVLENRQLNHRGFFVELLHQESGKSLTVPGAPYQLAKTPWRIARPSPKTGQHTSEILAELGYDSAAQRALIKTGAIA